MNLLLEEIQEDIKWRIAEISNLKTIPLRYRILESHKKTLIIYSIPSFYALWEGYIKNTFFLLTNYLNRQNIAPRNLNINLLTHAIENECKLGNERRDFNKKVHLIHSVLDIIDSPLNMKYGIPDESNVNYRVLNKILERFDIKLLDKEYEKPLNRLLLFRNKIAHGENSIQVSEKDVSSFSLLIENLMYEILVRIEDYLKTKNFKNDL